MKTDRHKKILELVDKYDIGTQEELAKILNEFLLHYVGLEFNSINFNFFIICKFISI